MSRSKKTWDHLVDYFGNYFPFDLLFGEDENGNPIFLNPKGDKGDKGQKGRRGFIGPGGTNGIDGDKGDKGDEGVKGEASGFLRWMGEVPERGDLPDLVDTEQGDVYRVALTGYYYISSVDENGNQEWVEITSGIAAIKGEDGQKGEEGAQGIKGVKGEQGDRLEWDDLTPQEQLDLKGDKGDEGEKGNVGDGGYDSAVKGGFKGTETEWFETLKGDKGDTGGTAYDNAVKGGFKGTETEYYDGLKGEKGSVGSGIEVIGNVNPGIDPNDPIYAPSYGQCTGPGDKGNALIDPSNGQVWICDGNGTWIDGGQLQGPQGEKGEVGDSAYEHAVKGGFKGTEIEYYDGLKGEKGDTGDSAFEEAVKGGFKGTGPEFLESLKGEKGETGNSAYEIAVKGGFKGTEAEFVEGLKGEEGDKGDTGPALDYDSLTPEQLKGLTGPKGEVGIGQKGDKGVKGEKLEYDDLTDTEQKGLVGPKGSKGEGGGLTDAPANSFYYGRYNGSWKKVVPLDLLQLPQF